MLLLKKLLSFFVGPTSLCLELLLLGLLLLWFTRRQRAGKILVTLGTLLLLLFSIKAFPDLLLRPLERQYAPVARASLLESRPPLGSGPIKWIVVLGGGHTSDPHLSAVSQLGEASLFRLLESIRLYRELPGARLILSGGAVFDPVPEAETLARVARALGLRQQDLILESASRDTADQARLVKDLVGRDRFVLVTSAAHLPRAVALFRKQGLEPIPCPTGYLVREPRVALNPLSYLPHPGNLSKAEIAFHEYLGLIWGRWRGFL